MPPDQIDPTRPFDIRAAGEELFGRHWFRVVELAPGRAGLLGPLLLAEILGINPRTMQRYAAGQNEVPVPIALHIEALLSIARQSRVAVARDRKRHARDNRLSPTGNNNSWLPDSYT